MSHSPMVEDEGQYKLINRNDTPFNHNEDEYFQNLDQNDPLVNDVSSYSENTLYLIICKVNGHYNYYFYKYNTDIYYVFFYNNDGFYVASHQLYTSAITNYETLERVINDKRLDSEIKIKIIIDSPTNSIFSKTGLSNYLINEINYASSSYMKGGHKRRRHKRKTRRHPGKKRKTRRYRV
jgi:hypothetical protein